MEIYFSKYQGTGNDFIMIDDREQQYGPHLTKAEIQRLCDRRFGIGADGLILLSPSEKADFRMVYFNADGGESTMCGNGGRCLTAFAHELGIHGPSYKFDAVDGMHTGIFQDGEVSLEMINPANYRSLGGGKAWIDTGSPHYLHFTDQAVEEIDVVGEGRRIRYSEPYAEIGGTNANFVNILDQGLLSVRTYERGVEDETLSCGTGVTASAYVYLLEHAKTDTSVLVDTKGGRLEVKVQDLGSPEETLFLSGPATFVFSGKIELNGN